MESENKLAVIENLLAPFELKAYRDFDLTGKEPVGLNRALQLYELFVRGFTCSQIVAVNPDLELGAVVKARVEHKWDDKKQEHIETLYNNAGGLLMQTAMESAHFLSVALASYNKLYLTQFQTFLQTGDPKDLPKKFVIDSIKNYKDLVETLIAVSGQNNKKEVRHVHTVDRSKDADEASKISKNAAEFLKLVEQVDSKKDSE